MPNPCRCPSHLVKFLLLLALGAFASPCQGALTVVARETFQGVGTLDATSSGAFSGFTRGAWQKRAVGPRAPGISAPGWSADAQGADTVSFFDLNALAYHSAQAGGTIGCWVRFVDFVQAGYYNAPGTANPALILSVNRADGPPDQCVGITATGHLVGTTAGGYFADGGAIAANTWYWVQISWLVSGGTCTFQASYRPLGGSATVIGTSTDSIAPARACALDQPYTFPPTDPYQDYHWRGRIGNVTLCSLTALADAATPADDLAPPPGPFQWFVNPATGNDANPGTTAAAPWATVAKLNAESTNAGLFGASAFATGDTVTIDTSAAPLDPGTAQIFPATPNVTFQPAPGNAYWTVRAEKDISAGHATWTQYDAANYPRIWQTTDGGAIDIGDGTYGAAVIWEDDRWLAHPAGANISSVAAAMNANAAGTGQCWADATTLYLVAGDNSNPNTNGRTYTRSRQRGGNGGDGGGSGASLVYAGNVPVQIIGLYARKTCLARGIDNDPYNAFGIQLDGIMPVGSTSRLASCLVEKTGKHGIGRTDSSSGHTVRFDACEVEQCSAYGSNSPFVDYNGSATATGNVSLWNGCINRYAFGLVGYAVPDYTVAGVYPGAPSYLSHNNNVGTQFSSISFRSCVLAGGLSGGLLAASVSVTDTRLVLASMSVPADFERCTFMGTLPSLFAGGTVRNCKVISTQLPIYNDTHARISGNVQLIGNTIDYTNPYQVVFGNSTYPLYVRDGALQLRCENNVVLTSAGQDFRFLQGASNADTLMFSHNAFDLGGSGYVLDAYNDGSTVASRTLAQVQSLGLDTGSFATANPQLDANGFPASGSPLVDAGSNLGALVDFTGRFFNARRTVGALEPLDTFARWQTQHFSDPEIAAGLGVPGADPDGDGRSNLLEYATGTDPKTADNGGATAYGLLSAGGQSYLTLTYRQLAYSGDLTYTPGSSGDLIQWQTGANAVAPVSRVDNGDGTATTTVRDTQPVGSAPARFLRLRVTSP